MVKPCEIPSPLAFSGTTVHTETLHMKWQNKKKSVRPAWTYTRALEIYILGQIAFLSSLFDWDRASTRSITHLNFRIGLQAVAGRYSKFYQWRPCAALLLCDSPVVWYTRTSCKSHHVFGQKYFSVLIIKIMFGGQNHKVYFFKILIDISSQICEIYVLQ